MKKKFIVRVHQKKYYAFVTAVSSGLFIIISLVCVCGLCMTVIEVSETALYAVTCFILAMGGYASGMICGKNRRRRGIVLGLKCGLFLWGIISVFGIVYMREISVGMLLKNLIFLSLPSVFGGIYGVNSKIKKPPY